MLLNTCWTIRSFALHLQHGIIGCHFHWTPGNMTSWQQAPTWVHPDAWQVPGLPGCITINCLPFSGAQRQTQSWGHTQCLAAPYSTHCSLLSAVQLQISNTICDLLLACMQLQSERFSSCGLWAWRLRPWISPRVIV